MIHLPNYLFINILNIYINLLKSLTGFGVNICGKLSSKLFNILINFMPP